MTNMGARTEAESVLDLADDDPVEALKWCLALLASKEMEVTEFRAARKQIVAKLQADGKSLAAIGDVAGRSKQIVSQWLR